ncbi:MAG: type VII toxin-antitoxin system MntA family adenylyltransferase antitoxin, partial [Roseimicrobium sp.]
MIALPRALIERELAAFQPSAIYLFGSCATEQHRVESDLDLAFLPQSGPCDPMEVFEAAQRIAELVSREVDLVDLSVASTVLRKEVVTGGTLLLDTDSLARQEFEMYALSDYARLNEERAPVLRALAA